MIKLHRKTTDKRLCVPADNVLAPEGGSRSVAESNGERRMAEFAVAHYGLRDPYYGYRLDRREDAVAYASLMRPRPSQMDTGGPFEPGKRFAPTTDAAHAFMTSQGIRFDDGAIRHDELSDAVNYAKLAPRPQRDDGD